MVHAASHVARDLAENVPAQSLIAKLLAEWDAGRIRLGESPDEVVIDDESRGWFWGVLGERRVAQVLATRVSDATVLHSIPIGSRGADIDHLVITPGGVFTVNTKYHADAVVWTGGYGLKVNRTDRPKYLLSAVDEAQRVEDRLSRAAGFAVPVYPVLAFVGLRRLTKTAPNLVKGVEVRVGCDADLPSMLVNRPELSDEQTARIAEVARMPSTWLKTVRPSVPGAHLAREFDALYEALGPSLDPALRTGGGRVRQTASAPARAAKKKSSVGARLLAAVAGLVLLPVVLIIVGQVLAAVIGATFSR